MTKQTPFILAQRLVACRLEALRSVEDAPNRGMWDYPTALRLAQESRDEALEALRLIEAQS